MLSRESICLRLAIDRLQTTAGNHFAIWVLESPYPGGYGHQDCVWHEQLSHLWQSWQQFFALRSIPQVPHVPSAYIPQYMLEETLDQVIPATQEKGGYTSRLMQGLGISLWQWLFSGVMQQSIERSLGIAMGQDKPLRLRLEIRDPALIDLPWEIMQPQAGRQAIALGQRIWFSRTTSAVDPLPLLDLDQGLRILLVLGQSQVNATNGQPPKAQEAAGQQLQLQAEAEVLKKLLERGTSGLRRGSGEKAPCQVDTLLEPAPAQVIKALETHEYNVFFYAGHGVPAPDGGLLFLQEGTSLNGTELAQVLTRCRIKLAVFNACWGAQPDQRNQRPIPRSSLAEVLLHHGVPAVLAMRDSIADEEALSFIQVFAQALAERQPVEQAVAVARQQLLTLYRFNHPAWTLPVLYMHPDFDGVILEPLQQDVTRLPGDTPSRGHKAAIRAVEDKTRIWPIYSGFMRVGRLPDNDMVIAEPWVSGQHAEIFCRNALPLEDGQPTYFLKDFSRFGTYYSTDNGWHHIHRGEVPLTWGTRLRFGSLEGRLLEFVLEGNTSISKP